MKKYLYVIKTTLYDSIQFVSSLFIRFIGFAVMMAILLSLWTYIYRDGNGVINGYTLNQMFWYLLLAEVITFGSGSRVATDEVVNCIRSGNIAYQVTKPYNYVIFTICKYYADTFIRFLAFLIVACLLGLFFVGIPDGISVISIVSAIPVFLLAVLITGMIKILISLASFWVEDSKPFQMVYNKIILIFGVFFPIEMFPKVIGSIIRYTPIYSVSYGPAKLVLSFSKSLFTSVIVSQLVTVLIVAVLLGIVYGIGVKKLNVNGG